jgi:hypothetical protein
MTRAVAFLAAALLAATLGAAQNTPTGAGSQSSSDVNGQSVTVTGCLSSSSLGDNHFKLTDDKGKVYSLAGLTDQLTSHAGQQVRITALDDSKNRSNSNASDSPNPSAGSAHNGGSGTSGNSGAAASAGSSSPQSLQVTSIQKMSDHCANGAGNKPEGIGAQTSERASAQVKLISYKSVVATDDDGTLAGSDGGQSSTEPATAAQGTTPDPAATNDLPRTATALPLLGILGLGSLVAGFIVRR